MNFLVDTNVLSEARKPDGTERVKRRLAATPDDRLFLSVVTLGEIAYGVARLPAGKRRRELEAWQAGLHTHFADRLLGIDADTARLWGQLAAAAETQGHRLDPADGLIAATALQHGLELMTRNAKHFTPLGVRVLNPWDDA